MTPSADPLAFIRANTRLRPVPHAPEIVLHVADEATELWQKTEDELAVIGLPPPFWAFAWAGGQALARYILDNPGLVAGRRVLDFASGSGLVAIAAARSGAELVRRVRKLAGEAGLRADITTGGAIEERRPYVLQTASDFALLDELAARVGYEWRVDGTTLRFEPRLAKVGDVPKLVFGDELRRFNARYSSAEHDKQTDVRSWDPRTGKTLVGTYKARSDDVGVVGSTAGLATAVFGMMLLGGSGIVWWQGRLTRADGLLDMP